jgi:pectate lyase
LTLTLVAAVPRSTSAISAFPGAEGFGANATGGRGGEVFHVVNTLNTNAGTYEGPDGYNRGTLRWCLLTEASTAPRTIVFDVGGQVTLSSQITLEGSNLTVAGQTAPGQGLTTAGRPWLIESGGNLVIRHLRNRLGRNGGQDSIGVEGGSNIIFDHVTSSWSNDEALSVAKQGTLVTVQNSLIYEGLNHSGHGYGSLIRPDVDSKVSYHHNLYANNESRNPRPGTYNSKTLEFDFRNNVVYNWGDRAGYSGGSSEGNPEYVNMNFVGNYAIAGPSTTNNATSAFLTDNNAAMTAYQSGNLIDSDFDATRDGVDTGWGMFEVEGGSLTQRATPHPLAPNPVTTHAAEAAYQNVLDYAGSFWWNRDSHDTRVVNQVRTQTGALINHQDDVGGFMPPVAAARDANWDTDHDGMPDHWETRHGLNPSLSSDRNHDFDTDGYTNLEEYLNEAGAWPAAEPIRWRGGNNRFALTQNWNGWQPSRFDVIELPTGTATVDAIGQHAGTIRIGTQAGSPATLKVEAGWLEVADEVLIGTGISKGHLVISGGRLNVPTLSLDVFSTFQFTGGTLSADTVGFDFVNKGGTIAPGRTVQGPAIGMTHVTGDLTLESGSLEIDLQSAASFDQLEIEGPADLGGALVVLADPTVDLTIGDTLLFLHANGGIFNAFDSVSLPSLENGKALRLVYGETIVGLEVVLAGDYNNDGTVDAADYTNWRDALASGGPLLNETASPGTIDQEDYATWHANFGAKTTSGSGSAAVPEPATAAFCWLGLATLLGLARRRP